MGYLNIDEMLLRSGDQAVEHFHELTRYLSDSLNNTSTLSTRVKQTAASSSTSGCDKIETETSSMYPDYFNEAGDEGTVDKFARKKV